MPLTPAIAPRTARHRLQEGIVDLSVRPELLAPAKDKSAAKAAAKALKAGVTTEANVELMKDGYAVVSLADSTTGSKDKSGLAGTLAFVATTDYNMIIPDQVPRKLALGQRLTVTLAVLPTPATGGRLLATTTLHKATDSTGSAAGAGQSTKPGSVVTATVTALHPCWADVSLGRKATGRLHLTEVIDLADKSLPGGSPLDTLRVGQSLEAVVLGRLGSAGGRHHGTLELSIRPSVLEAAKKVGRVVQW